MVNTEQIKQLRAETGISVAQCKNALEASNGDYAGALDWLKAKGVEIAGKKGDRQLGAGVISAYIHAGGSIGVLLELLCETDFVSGNPGFKAVADDLAMHIAATAPENVEALLAEDFIKDPSLKIEAVISGATQKFGERVVLARFSRFAVGA